MKLRSPSGCSAASHAGFPIEIDANGYVDVDDDIATALLSHGFEPETKMKAHETTQRDGESDSVDQLKRGDLFALLKAKGVSVSLPVTNEELRRLVHQTNGERANSSLPDVKVKGS